MILSYVDDDLAGESRRKQDRSRSFFVSDPVIAEIKQSILRTPRPANVSPNPQTAQHIADGSTLVTYAMLFISGALAWFDAHASGLMAVAAVFTALVNWWYRRAASKWDGKNRRAT